MTTDEMIALFRRNADIGSINWQIADRIETLDAELRRQVERTDEQREAYEAALNAMEAERDALALQVQWAREEGWNAALGEAAQVVSGMWPREINLWPEEWSDRADDIAAAIRALRGATEEAGG
jgi:hypothetical protein